MARKSTGRSDGLVYSSEFGRNCPVCRRPLTSCNCQDAARTAAPSDGIVRVGRQTKGRKGKGVTVITGVPLSGGELAELAKALKRRCGSGGTLRGDVIEIQGDHRDVLVAELEKRGWTVKRAGG